MVLQMGGQPIKTKALPETVNPETPDRIVLFMRLVAMSCEARRDLADAVRRARTLERKLADPALADHPGRGKAERRLARRQDEAHHATVRLIEVNVSLERQWQEIAPADKHRYGLTFLTGEPDPDANILVRLWADNAGLARLVPFPDDWTIPHDISHRAFDTTAGVNEISREELFHAEYAVF